MGFVHDLGKMACRPPSQKSSDAVSQYFVAVYRHIYGLFLLNRKDSTYLLLYPFAKKMRIYRLSGSGFNVQGYLD
jgi:hypothetical protein